MSLNRKRFTLLCFAGHAVNDTYWFILPIVLPMILAQFGLTYASAGGVLTAYLLVNAVFSTILGKLSDRVPRWKIIGTGFFLASSGLLLAGFMNHLAFFVLTLLLAAVGVSTFHPVIYALIEETISTKRGVLYGGFEFWATFALVIFFLLSGTLLNLITWKGVIVVTSLPGFLMGILFLNAGRKWGQEKNRHMPSVEQPAEIRTPSVIFILFLLVSMLRLLSLVGVMNFTPTYFTDTLGLHPGLATYATGFYFLGGMAGARLVGRLADRRAHLPLLAMIVTATAPLIFLMSLPLPPWLFPFILILLGGTSLGCTPLQNMLISRLGYRLGKGEVFGLMMGTLTLANSLSPVLFGFLADHTSLRLSVRLFSLPVFLGWIILLFLARIPALRQRHPG